MAQKVFQDHPAAPGTQETGVLGGHQGSRAGRETVGHRASWERRARRETVVCQAHRVRRVRWEPQGTRGHRAERELQDQVAPGGRRVTQDHLADQLPAWLVLERRVTEVSQDQKDLLAPRVTQEIKVPVVPLA